MSMPLTKKALVDGVTVDARNDELDAESGGITDHNERDHLDGAHHDLVQEHRLPRVGRGDVAQAQVVLVSNVPGAKQQGGNHGHNDQEHRPLEVDAVADVHAFGGGVTGGKQERLQGIEDDPEALQFAVSGEIGLDALLDEFVKGLHGSLL